MFFVNLKLLLKKSHSINFSSFKKLSNLGRYILKLFYYSYHYFIYFYFLAVPREILVPQPGTEPVPPAVEVQILTTRPPGSSLNFF